MLSGRGGGAISSPVVSEDLCAGVLWPVADAQDGHEDFVEQ